jgi:hypothetical protein
MRILTMFCAAAMAICGTVRAQSTPDLITVHFSTSVMVGGAMLPEGDCSIQVLRGSSDNIILAVRSASGTAASVLVNRLNESRVETNGHVSVILSRRNNVYQLEQIVLPDHTGFQILD